MSAQPSVAAMIRFEKFLSGQPHDSTVIQTSKSAVADPIYVRGVDYGVLGPLEVISEGKTRSLGGPKQRAVLAVLVAAAGRPVSVDALLQAVYGDDAPPNSRATLHTYVSNLRSTLGDVIVRRADAYLLDMTASATDAFQFEQAYNAALQLGSAEDMASRLRDALSMWRGHPYADVEAHGHLDGQITRLNELRLAAIEARIDADLRAGRHREVVAELDALTVEYPFRESLRAMHMLALYRSGRQGDALRAYAHTRVVLVEELGIDPSPQLQELERRILQQDRQLLIDVAPTIEQRAVVVADIDDSGWSGPAEREISFARRDSALAWAADEHGGVRLAQKGTAAYAVFSEPIEAVRAARAAVDERTRVAVDFGDLQLDDGEPVGPPLARAARLVAVAHPAQALLSPAAHEALILASVPGWAAQSLGRFDIVGLDRGLQIFQLVGSGFGGDFPDLVLDRLPPPLPSAAERSIPGYELRALLGVGELGEVHRAYQPSVGREVAVRVFGPGMVGHPQFLRRFETAAQRISRVEHPGVVPLLDYWREPTRAVLVSRLLTGGTLIDRLPEGGYDIPTAMRVFETVASAVASAHRRGIVHGRLRPHNVLFDEDDNAHVGDFGVDEMCTGVTTFATSAYDAPERLGGALATPAADIYSLGVLLNVLISGLAPPADADLPRLSSPAADVVARATDNEPHRRHCSVEELVIDLREHMVGSGGGDVFVPTRNPYRGLAAFERADAGDFFGRDRVTSEMIAILQEQPLLWVVGPSGIGKSSTVKAGVLPALANGALPGSESWLVTEMVPGRSPLGQLAAALARIATDALPDVVGDLMAATRSLDEIVARVSNSNVVVMVIDQLEELFTETVDDRERRAFLQVLVNLANAPSGAVRVIATMRADFFDRPLAYPGFADAVKGRSVVLGAMSLAELAEAVTRPAAGVGVDIDPVLVDQLTADAALQPGSLPLLQQVMTDLFARRTSSIIGIAAYAEAGGLAGAVGRQADAIYQSLDDHHRDVARRLFLRLVNVSEESDDTRRRVRRTELEQAGLASEDLDIVLAEFGNERLLTFDRDPTSRTPTVEVAHEALLNDWSRLKGWIDDAREDLLHRRRLELATHEWINANCDSSFLIGGGRLELTEQWAVQSGFALTHDEKQFISTSRAKSDRDVRTRARRRRRAVGGLLVALLATATLAGVALSQRKRADHSAAEAISQRNIANDQKNAAEQAAQRASDQQKLAEANADEASRQQQRAEDAADDATRQKNLADARRLGTQAQLVENYDKGLLLAVEARHVDDSDDTRGDLLAAIQRSPSAVAVIRSNTDVFLDLGIAQDGKTLVAAGHTGPRTYDVATRTPRGSFSDSLEYVDGAISADGTRAVISGVPGGQPYELDIVDTATLRVVGDPLYSNSTDGITRLSFSPDDRYVAGVTDNVLTGAGLVPAVAEVWDTATGGTPILRYPFSAEYQQRDVRFLDSSRIAVAGSDGTSVLDIATGQKVAQIDAYAPLTTSPDGRLLAATTDRDHGVIVGLFDVATGKVDGVLAGHHERIRRLLFSPDGAMLASGGDDHLVMLWDVASGERRDFPGHAARVNALVFSRDQHTLWSGGDDSAVIAWDLQRASTLVHQLPRSADAPALPFPSTDMVISPDGRYVAFPSGHDGSQFEIREVATGAVVRAATLPPEYFQSFSPDGKKYLTVSEQAHLRVWDLASGSMLIESPTDGSLYSMFPPGPKAAFTADERRVVAIQVDTSNSDLDADYLVVLDADTLEPLAGAPVFLGEKVRAVGVAPDGHTAVAVVSGTVTGPWTNVVLVDLEAHQIVRSTAIELLGEPLGGARNDAIAADGRTAGVGSRFGDVVVVDAVTGNVHAHTRAHNGTVESVTFSPDNTRFVTTSEDGAVRFWNNETQQLISTDFPLGENQRVRARFISDDRLLIVSGSGEVFEWNPSPDGLETYACTVAGRNLTKTEWSTFFADQEYRSTCPQFPPGL